MFFQLFFIFVLIHLSDSYRLFTAMYSVLMPVRCLVLHLYFNRIYPIMFGSYDKNTQILDTVRNMYIRRGETFIILSGTDEKTHPCRVTCLLNDNFLAA